MYTDNNDSLSAESQPTSQKGRRKYKDEAEKKKSCNFAVKSSTIDDFLQTCAYNGVNHGDELGRLMDDYIEKNGLEISIPKKEKKIAEETALLEEMKRTYKEYGSLSNKRIMEFLKKKFDDKPVPVPVKGAENKVVYATQTISYKRFCIILAEAQRKFKKISYMDIVSFAGKAIGELPEGAYKENLEAQLQERMQRMMSPSEQSQQGDNPGQATKTPIMTQDEGQ